AANCCGELVDASFLAALQFAIGPEVRRPIIVGASNPTIRIGAVMKTVRGTYQGGKIRLAEKPKHPGPTVVFLEVSEDDPWEKILNDPTPRPASARLVKQVKKEIAQGKAKPLNLDDL